MCSGISEEAIDRWNDILSYKDGVWVPFAEVVERVGSQALAEYGLPLVAIYMKRVVLDQRWQHPTAESTLLLYFENGNRTFLRERPTTIRQRYKRHCDYACLKSQLCRLLKLSEQEWQEVGFPAPQPKQPIHAVALSWFQAACESGIAFSKFEGCTQVGFVAVVDEHGGVEKLLFEQHLSGYHSRKGKRVEIVVRARYFRKSHPFCLKLRLRTLPEKGFGPLCECCQQFSSQLNNGKQPTCRTLQCTPVTLLMDLGLLSSAQVSRLVGDQAKLIQYFSVLPNGNVGYADYFESLLQQRKSKSPLPPRAHVAEFSGWRGAFDYGIQRHEKAGGKAWRSHFDAAFNKTREIVAATKAERGTFWVAHRRIQKARDSALFACYNVGKETEEHLEGDRTVGNIFGAFASACSALGEKRKLNHALVRVNRSKDKSCFYNISWRHVTLFELSGIITVPLAHCPPLEELAREVLPQQEPVPEEAGTVERLSSCMRQLMKHRLDWLHVNYGMEWISLPLFSLSGIAEQSIQHAAYSADPMAQTLEAFSPTYANCIRKLNTAGMLHYSRQSLGSSQPLGPGAEAAKSLFVFDQTLSYGSSMAGHPSPGRFVKAFHNVLRKDGDEENVLRSADSFKVRFFEFSVRLKGHYSWCADNEQ